MVLLVDRNRWLIVTGAFFYSLEGVAIISNLATVLLYVPSLRTNGYIFILKLTNGYIFLLKPHQRRRPLERLWKTMLPCDYHDDETEYCTLFVGRVGMDGRVETGARCVPPNRIRLRVEGEGMDESTAERRAISWTAGGSLREVDPI